MTEQEFWSDETKEQLSEVKKNILSLKRQYNELDVNIACVEQRRYNFQIVHQNKNYELETRIEELEKKVSSLQKKMGIVDEHI